MIIAVDNNQSIVSTVPTLYSNIWGVTTITNISPDISTFSFSGSSSITAPSSINFFWEASSDSFDYDNAMSEIVVQATITATPYNMVLQTIPATTPKAVLMGEALYHAYAGDYTAAVNNGDQTQWWESNIELTENIIKWTFGW
jgi:hypothetical protein